MSAPDAARGPRRAGEAPSATTNALDSLALADRIAEIASDRKALDIRLVDLRGLVAYTDTLVVCSGNTERQTKAIHDSIYMRLKDDHGLLPRRVEGEREARWILMDYLDCWRTCSRRRRGSSTGSSSCGGRRRCGRWDRVPYGAAAWRSGWAAASAGPIQGRWPEGPLVVAQQSTDRTRRGLRAGYGAGETEAVAAYSRSSSTAVCGQASLSGPCERFTSPQSTPERSASSATLGGRFRALWGYSSAGRAFGWQPKGRRFESD